MPVEVHVTALSLRPPPPPLAGVGRLGKAAAAAGVWLLLAATARAETVAVVAEGVRHAFEVEVADEPAERAQGLMFREHLAADRGMLFDLGGTYPVSFWMKNTLIPLDMLFIDEGGRVVAIEAEAQPHDLRSHGPDRPVRGVLEVPGGTAERLGIGVGAYVCHTIFAPPEGVCPEVQ